MRTAINVYAAPERLMTEAALASIYQYFGIPTFGMGGCTDAQVLDEQAGAECGMMALWAALTGINLAHDAGYLGSGMIGDLRAIVLNDEVNSYVRHVLVRGLIVNDDTRAIEALAHLGPGGHFLADEHTVDHFRTEFWFPTLFNRLTLGTWIEKGKKSTKELLAEKVRQILSSHQPKALPATIISQLEKMAGC
jgi:trimethylamine--corrinoid protein Co-methyltransferase